MDFEPKIDIGDGTNNNGKITGVAVAVIVVLVVLAGLAYYFFYDGQKGPNLSPEELFVQQQKVELDQLRQEAGAKPLTLEEIEDQKKELDQLRQDAGTEPLTQKEIEEQKDDLDDLRRILNP